MITAQTTEIFRVALTTKIGTKLSGLFAFSVMLSKKIKINPKNNLTCE
jgi:hypothetical protein